MARIDTKIKEYCKANGVSDVEFMKDVMLQNDGNGAYIKEWNLDIDQPTDSQLSSYETVANATEALNVILQTRKISYPDLREQLDLLYKDMAADKGDKTGEWFKAVKKVKDDNPK